MSSLTATPALRSQPPDASAAGPLGLIRRHPIAALLVLTFGLTWLLEIPRVLDARGAAEGGLVVDDQYPHGRLSVWHGGRL